MLAMPGWLLAAIGGFISHGKGSWSILMFIGIAMFVGGVLMGLFCGRCLSCRRKLGQAFSQTGGKLWQISNDLRYCPYCGESLDQPAAPSGEAAK
jgi:hypothetical protein